MQFGVQLKILLYKIPKHCHISHLTYHTDDTHNILFDQFMLYKKYHTTSHDIISNHITAHHITSHHTKSHLSHNITSHLITSYKSLPVLLFGGCHLSSHVGQPA